MGGKKQRKWGNKNTVEGGGGPPDVAKKREQKRGKLMKNDNWKDRKEKKEELQYARVNDVYGRLTELVERYVDLGFNREDEILIHRGAPYRCGVSVDSNLVVSASDGQGSFDLEEESAGRNLISFLNSRDLGLKRDKVYWLLGEIVKMHTNLRFDREREVLICSKGNNHQCRVSEDSKLVVQGYKNSEIFDLRYGNVGRDLVRFLNRRGWEDD